MNNIDLKKIINECGVELYDDEIVNENGKKIYRIYICKSGGVSLDDCERVSKILSPIFDVNQPPIDGEWALEISSPGIERKLSKPIHFINSIGDKIIIKTINKTTIEGILTAFKDNLVSLQTDNGLVDIKMAEIKMTKTKIDWEI